MQPSQKKLHCFNDAVAEALAIGPTVDVFPEDLEQWQCIVHEDYVKLTHFPDLQVGHAPADKKKIHDIYRVGRQPFRKYKYSMLSNLTSSVIINVYINSVAEIRRQKIGL